MRDVHLEFLAARSAHEVLSERLRADPSWGQHHGWRHRDADRCGENLEGTYTIRLFAEFESGLREAWRRAFGQTTYPPMRDLLAAVTARRRIPDSIHDPADEVREYRNSLVHSGEVEDLLPIPVADVLDRLSRYFSRLPHDW